MVYSGKIIKINEGSLAQELGLRAGDKIISVNDQPLTDIIDLSFAMADEEISLLIEHDNGEQAVIDFEKDYDEELGVEFESAVFNGIRRCGNNCAFCFVDQIAPNMRSSLSVKDDDYRMSFLYGNFVTMTNMGPRDFDRIQKLHLTPLYLSIHTTNPELRARMMNSKRAKEVNKQLDLLDSLDIQYHTQIVLCPHFNDGAELEKTISDISARIPHALSIAIVPVGLTKYRQDCYPLTMFNAQQMHDIVRRIEKWQEEFRAKTNTSFVYLSDEFYLNANLPLPKGKYYDGFPQLDNGIGLSRNLLEEWKRQLKENTNTAYAYEKPLSLAIVCGKLAGKVFQLMLENFTIDNLSVKILAVGNDFFGHDVTVTGLLTGQDIANAVKKEVPDCDGVIIPACALRTGEDIFLDDWSLDKLKTVCNKEMKVAADAKAIYKLLTQWHAVKDVRENNLYTWQSNAAYTK